MSCRPTCIQPSPSNAHPLTIGLHADRRGVWRHPGPDDTKRVVWPHPVAEEAS